MAGIPEAPITIKDSVEGLVAQVCLEVSILPLVELAVVLTFAMSIDRQSYERRNVWQVYDFRR
jgi:hypothetical protein